MDKLLACLNMCVTNLQWRLRFFNVCFHWLDVTAADSRPAHLPKAECQSIMRYLVVKFRIWQNALKPSRLQMQRKQPVQSDDFPFLCYYITLLFASSQTNDQTVQWLCHCLDTDLYCLSHYIPGYIWQKQLLVMSLWCFLHLTCWEN